MSPWFNIEEMVHDVVALQEQYGIMIYDIHRLINMWEVFMGCYIHYPLIYCLCEIVGLW